MFIILNLIFHLKVLKKKKFKEELSYLNINKGKQNFDISTNTIKENSNISGDYICLNLNSCINTSLYPSLLKNGKYNTRS